MTVTPPTAELRRGWPVILACGIGVGLGNTGLAFYSMTLFITPLMHAFGWNRAELSGASFCLLIGTIVTSPFVGRLIDRFGAMRVAMFSMLANAIGFAGLSYTAGSLTQFYACWLFISFLGTGTTPVIWSRTVTLWFRRHLGLALAITLCGTGVVAMLAPSLINHIMSEYGWRAAYRCMAAVIVVIGMPLVYLLLRRKIDAVRPFDVLAVTSDAAAAPQSLHINGTASLALAMRTPTFWRMAVGIALASAVIAGLAVHIVPMMIDTGLSRSEAAGRMGMLGVAIIVGRLSIGALLDRASPRLVSFCALVLPGLSCLLMAGHVSAEACVIVLGLAAGSEVDLLAFMVRRYFGIPAYAAIYGSLISCFSVGASVGPLIAGHLRDVNGNYSAVLYAGALAALIGASLFGTLTGASETRAVETSMKSY